MMRGLVSATESSADRAVENLHVRNGALARQACLFVAALQRVVTATRPD